MSRMLTSRNKLILLFVLIVGLIVAVFLSQRTQQSDIKAAPGETIDHINLYYTSEIMEIAELPMYMSALAVDSNEEPVEDVFYSWGISSSVSLGRLIETNQNISGFQPLNVGSGDVFVTAIKGDQEVTKSFRMNVVDSFSSTPPPGSSTAITFNIYLHGRGKGGDSANPNGSGNMNPLHTNLPFTASFHNNSDDLVGQSLGQLSFDNITGKYTGLILVPNYIPTGLYSIRVHTDSYLQKLIPGFYLIEPDKSYTTNAVRLITGDAMVDNQLNILDYNRILGCYEDLTPATDCDSTRKLLTDFNDDGKVNQIDYNLFLREISVQAGQ